jgi:hypothetical protein
MPDGTLIFSSNGKGSQDFWRMRVGDPRPTPLLTDQIFAGQPVAVGEREFLFTRMPSDGTASI